MHRTHRLTLFLVSAAVVAGSVGVSVYALRSAKKPQPNAVTVATGDLIRQVSVSGDVKAATDVDLAFQRAGIVANAYARVGDKVSAGQLIAVLDSADLDAQLEQAQAAQAAAEARLASVKRGARPEDVGVSDAAVDAAKTALDEARRAMIDKLQDAYAKADDAIHGKADQLFAAPTGQTPKLAFFIPDDRLAADLGWRRYQMEETLHEWQSATAALSASSDLGAAAATSRADLDTVRAFLDDAVIAVDKIDVSSNPGMVQATVDGYKAGLSLARANVLAAQASVTAGLQQVAAAGSALDVASSQKTLKVAAPATEDVAAQEAAVRQAIAAVDAVRVQIAKLSLRSPMSGVLSKQDAKVGATAVPGAPVATVLSDGLEEIDAIVPEADIADVKLGEPAAVTLDAYGPGQTFAASVAAIDPAETTVDGLAGYKTTLQFSQADPRIKPGMTANVRIDAGERKDVVIVPREDVLQRDGKAYVLVIDGDAVVQREITLGIEGQDGLIEVASGLNAGDRVVDFRN